MDAQKRKQGFKREIPKIELEAVYNTTCKKCGGKGKNESDSLHEVLYPNHFGITRGFMYGWNRIGVNVWASA